jgi:penicillin amidase
MKKRRVVFYQLLPLLVLAIAASNLCSLHVHTAVTQVNTTTLRLAGLRGRVTVRRDERGIPYVEAANEADLYYAQGYITASDRLWQMDILRRTARGELSEIFGQATLEEDKNHRTYGFAPLSEAMLPHCSAAFRAALDAYARGVNAFIESRDAQTLPLEFRLLRYSPRPWQPSDSLIIGKLFAETLSTTWPADLMRASLTNLSQERRGMLLPEISPLDLLLVGSDRRALTKAVAKRPPAARQPYALIADALLTSRRALQAGPHSLERIGLYAEDLAASNNWVVSGKHTSSGKPLLANDLHLAPSVPSIWYMTDLCGKDFHVAGVTAPGVPGIIVGHNDWIAWGMTNLGADVQDIYLETFNKENPRQYLTPDGWRDAVVRSEEIKVRKKLAEPATDTIPFEVKVTRQGPIIFGHNSNYYALRWTALEADAVELEAFLEINRARNWKEFRSALSRYPGPAQNFIYADVNGHIGYHASGRIPIRKSVEGILPYDGVSDAADWKGFVPFDALPHIYDPPSGIIVTANQRIVGTDYPYYLTREWQEPYRARRIYDLLKAKQKLTVDDFRAIQGDTYSFPDAIFTREVVKFARSLAGSSPDWRAVLDAFSEWDAVSKAESRAMPLAVKMRGAFRRHILTTALGEERAKQYRWANEETFIDQIITARPSAWLPKEFDSYEALILACYQEARQRLREQLGADEALWTWGRTEQIRFRHPLAGISPGAQFSITAFPRNTGGTSTTVNAGMFVSMRFITDIGGWNDTRLNIALGESGDPASPYWKDQLQEWHDVSPRIFSFTKTAIARATKQMLILTP